MPGLSGQDSFPHSLLDAYLAVARRRPAGSLAVTALRTRSVAARHLLARLAWRNGSLEELTRAAHHGSAQIKAADVNALALADLARVVSLQEILPGDQRDGLAFYDLIAGLHGHGQMPPEHQGIHAQLAFHLGDYQKAASLHARYQRQAAWIQHDLPLDLANPFLPGTTSAKGVAPWLASFQSMMPEPAPELTADESVPPFDRLTTQAPERMESSHRVTVIITAFKPDGGLVTAVQSILAQSWVNLEILLIDDASPAEHDELLTYCAAMDDRIRLVKAEVNAGTYAARNLGLDLATGEFITFQDSDDWSHPRRIESQVLPLLTDSGLVATVSDALRVSEQLVLTKPGRNPRIMNTSSLMFRKAAIAERLGYFDSVRKAADSEFVKRIESAFGIGAVHRLRNQFYALIRQAPNSLSRAEIRAGWMDPSRISYRAAYASWHEGIKSANASAYLDRNAVTRPFPAPARLLIAQPAAPRYDVIFMTDWRAAGAAQATMTDEINALVKSGRRVGVMHLESYRQMTPYQRGLYRPLQDLINTGSVDHVLYSDAVEANLLIVQYPSVLQFAPDQPSGVRPRRVIIVADSAPSRSDGSDLQYSAQACTAFAARTFGTEPQWAPRCDVVREHLRTILAAEQITPFTMPTAIDVDSWHVDREGFRSGIPIVGRHSRDKWGKWPADKASLLAAYPDSKDVDVRILGGAKGARALLRQPDLPQGWLVYERDEISVRSFLYQIDYFVYFPHPGITATFSRSVLESLAMGCVAVLPHHFAAAYGDAAVYADPSQVTDVIAGLHKRPKTFLAQSRRAAEYVAAQHGYRPYSAFISSLLAA